MGNGKLTGMRATKQEEGDAVNLIKLWVKRRARVPVTESLIRHLYCKIKRKNHKASNINERK
jgi:hypothetical protein